MLKDLLKGGLGIGFIVFLVVATICLVPMVTLWCLNSLSEAGGSSFYIDHSLYNYFLAFVFVALMRGGSS